MKKGMRQTEIGWIPEDWEIENLGNVGEIRMCRRVFNNQTTETGEIPFYKIGTFGKVPDAFITRKHFSEFKSKYYFPSKGDILISAAGTIGRTILYDGEEAYFQDSNIVWIENNFGIISNELLSHVLKTVNYNTEGGTIQRLYNGILKATKFICPPLGSEQQAIAKALSDADAWIESLETQLHKKRLIKQGAMQVLLRPKGGWKVKKLGEVATLKARIGWQGLTTAEYKTSGEARLVTGTEFHAGTVHWEACHYVDFKRYQQDANIQLRQYDILVTKDGTIGKVAFIDEVEVPTTLNSGIFVIRPINNSFIPRFMSYILLSDVFKDFLSKLAAGSTISHLYQKDFIHFHFTLPEIDEQLKISKVLSDIDADIEALETKVAKARQIKQGMMQQLLTGQIRLVKQPENEQTETLQRAIA